MDFDSPVDLNKTYGELTSEENARFDQQKMYELHLSQEPMYSRVARLIVAFVITQIVIMAWKKRHYRSYAFFTTVAMWTIPLAMSVRRQWWRFIIVWVIFTMFMALIIRKSALKPMSVTTPRLVYKWFYLIYKVCCFMATTGFVITILTFCALNLVFGHKPQEWIDVSLMLLFYGLYFGALSRDVAKYCSGKMATSIGYYTPEGLPTRQLATNMCAVCGGQLLLNFDQKGVSGNAYKLRCQHVFHEYCIRDWCIVGKKQTCPYCMEKVDFKRILTKPWDQPHILFDQLFDWTRWLAVWPPLILILSKGIKLLLGIQ